MERFWRGLGFVLALLVFNSHAVISWTDTVGARQQVKCDTGLGLVRAKQYQVLSPYHSATGSDTIFIGKNDTLKYRTKSEILTDIGAASPFDSAYAAQNAWVAHEADSLGHKAAGAYGDTTDVNNRIARNLNPTIQLFFTGIASTTTGNFKLLDSLTGLVTFTSASLSVGTDSVNSYITEPGFPGVNVLPAGLYNLHIHLQANTTGSKNITGVFYRLYYTNSSGVITAQVGTDSYTTGAVSTSAGEYNCFFNLADVLTIGVASRLKIKVYATVTGAGGTATLSILEGDNSHDSHLDLPITSAALNGLFLKLHGKADSCVIADTVKHLPDTISSRLGIKAPVFTGYVKGFADSSVKSQHAVQSDTSLKADNRYQLALTNPITGTGTNGTYSLWTGAHTQGNGLLFQDGNGYLTYINPNGQFNFQASGTSGNHFASISWLNADQSKYLNLTQYNADVSYTRWGYVQANTGELLAANEPLFFGATGNNPLHFGTNNAEQFRITNGECDVYGVLTASGDFYSDLTSGGLVKSTAGNGKLVNYTLQTGDIPDLSGTYLPLHATADKAAQLATARTIGGTSFDGTANIMPDSSNKAHTVNGGQVIADTFNCHGTVIEKNGSIGVNTTSPDAVLKIGTIAPSGANPTVALGITKTTTGRGFHDASNLAAGSSGQAYCSYDAAPTTSGSQNIDHIIAFQASPTHTSSGAIGTIYGSSISPYNNGGSCTNAYDYVANDMQGSGTASTQYGFLCQPMTKATTNWSFYSGGSTKSYFGGYVGFGSLYSTQPLFPIEAGVNTSGQQTIATFQNNDYTSGNRTAIKIRQATGSSSGKSAYVGVDKNTGNVFITNDNINDNDITISPTYQVGINTANSDSTLTVNGSCHITGNFRVDGQDSILNILLAGSGARVWGDLFVNTASMTSHITSYVGGSDLKIECTTGDIHLKPQTSVYNTGDGYTAGTEHISGDAIVSGDINSHVYVTYSPSIINGYSGGSQSYSYKKVGNTVTVYFNLSSVAPTSTTIGFTLPYTSGLAANISYTYAVLLASSVPSGTYATIGTVPSSGNTTFTCNGLISNFGGFNYWNTAGFLSISGEFTYESQ